MRLTIAVESGEICQIEVDHDEQIENVKALVSVELGIPLHVQELCFSGRVLGNAEKLSTVGIRDNDLLLVRRTAARNPALGMISPAGFDPSTHFEGSLSSIPANLDPAALMRLITCNSHLLRELTHVNPDLAEAMRSEDLTKVRTVMMRQSMNSSIARLRDQQQESALANADPLDPEAQARIEEKIRMGNVQQNMELAMEELPESFARVVMLYVDTVVNGVALKAFVDSGAQSTIMSVQCAERCGIMRLVDRRFAGQAVGVGTAPIIGRVHMADLKLGSSFFPCTFTIIDNPDMDFLFGLDMLKRHQCIIDLRCNALRIGDQSVPFLSEKDLPMKARNTHESEVEVSPAPIGSQARLPGRGGSSAGTPAVASSDTSRASSSASLNIQQFVPRGAPSARPMMTIDRSPPRPMSSMGAACDSTVPPPTRNSGAAVADLMALGFSQERVLAVLAQCDGNVDLAASLLFSSIDH